MLALSVLLRKRWRYQRFLRLRRGAALMLRVPVPLALHGWLRLVAFPIAWAALFVPLTPWLVGRIGRPGLADRSRVDQATL